MTPPRRHPPSASGSPARASEHGLCIGDQRRAVHDPCDDRRTDAPRRRLTRTSDDRVWEGAGLERLLSLDAQGVSLLPLTATLSVQSLLSEPTLAVGADSGHRRACTRDRFTSARRLRPSAERSGRQPPARAPRSAATGAPTLSLSRARSAATSAKCSSLGVPSTRYRPSQRIAARSYVGDPR